jgi:hypothetical protein
MLGPHEMGDCRHGLVHSVALLEMFQDGFVGP